MIKPVHVYTATCHKPDGTSTYAAIALRDRRHITITGQVQEPMTTAAIALRAAVEGVKAARAMIGNPISKRFTPITVCLPSANLAQAAATGKTNIQDPKAQRLLKILAKAQVITNLKFTAKPMEQNSAVDMICQYIAKERATGRTTQSGRRKTA